MVRSEGRALRVNQRGAARAHCETAVLVGLWGAVEAGVHEGVPPLAGLTMDKVSRETLASIGVERRRCNICSLGGAANYGTAGSSPASGIEHSLAFASCRRAVLERKVCRARSCDGLARQTGPRQGRLVRRADRRARNGAAHCGPVSRETSGSRFPASPPGLPAQDPVAVRWCGLHADVERPLHLAIDRDVREHGAPQDPRSGIPILEAFGQCFT